MNPEHIIYKDCKTYYDMYLVAKETILSHTIKSQKLQNQINLIDNLTFFIILSIIGISFQNTLLIYISAPIMFTRHIMIVKKNILIKELNIKIKNLVIERDIFTKLHNESIEDNNINNENNRTRQRGTFKTCITITDIKKVYREKAKKHHPDLGGDPKTFRILNKQYKRALDIAKEG